MVAGSHGCCDRLEQTSRIRDVVLKKQPQTPTGLSARWPGARAWVPAPVGAGANVLSFGRFESADGFAAAMA
jgi:hypothetical protein